MLGGQLITFFGLTVVVTALLAWLAVWHYGRRVLAGMQQRAGQALDWPATAPTRAPPRGNPAQALAWLRRTQRRAAAGWVASAFLAALPVSASFLAADGSLGNAAQWLMVASVLAMVAVPVLATAFGWAWPRGLAAAAVGLLLGAVLTLLAGVLGRLARGAAPGWDQLANLGYFFEGAALLLLLPTLLLVLSGPRRIRQVVPLVFGALLLFALAPFLGTRALFAAAASDEGTRWVLALGGIGVFRHGVFVLLALPMAAVVAWRLRVLARGHAAKRFSDLQLLARSWWLMLLCGLVIELVNTADGPQPAASWGAPACALAGLAFAPLNRWVLRRWPAPADGAPPPRTLLFLRAFGWQSRTERLFDRLGARWRWLGPITMIAAPDTVARSMDPVDLAAYLQGREAEAFVRSAADLGARLAALDRQRDPDGRFRLNEFCCADDTWRATVVALMDRADAVVMDLRGVRDPQHGCAFELGQLAQRLPPKRVVLVVDAQTLLPPLRDALGAAADAVIWHRLDGERQAGHDALFTALVWAAS